MLSTPSVPTSGSATVLGIFRYKTSEEVSKSIHRLAFRQTQTKTIKYNCYISVTIPTLVPQNRLSVLNFLNVAQPQKLGKNKFDEQSEHTTCNQEASKPPTSTKRRLPKHTESRHPKRHRSRHGQRNTTTAGIRKELSDAARTCRQTEWKPKFDKIRVTLTSQSSF